jgi:preprotein translocase subunit SecA
VQQNQNGGALQYEHENTSGAAAIAAAGGQTLVQSSVATQTIQASPHEKLGRNEPCWCGSGKKFKKCHGA